MNDKKQYKYLDSVNSPKDLKGLSVDQLEDYCAELRDFIVSQLATNPGHLASSLGAVELAVAVHYVFDAPEDKLIWDVGHQAYAHKIITGRAQQFSTNRKYGGLSGFPKMSESEYDAFGAGHASVSISAGLGMSVAGKLKGDDNSVVAIIGDGSMTGGLAFEGLNNAGSLDTDLLVILNDNQMAITQNTGALTDYLVSMTTSHKYNRLKSKMWNALSGMPRLRRGLQSLANVIKQGLLHNSNIFEGFNFRYFGPVDGNDVKSMVKVLKNLKTIKGPKLLHALTVKGKGYLPAEKDQSVWHSPGKFDAATGEITKSKQVLLYQQVFGKTLLELAKADEKIVGITPAMVMGSSLNYLMDEFPERCFDVGIAEGHAITFAAGLACSGMRPFCAIYSSFVQRAYDNIIHDVAIQGLPVVICIDRAGLVGEDGATHHGVFDIAALRPVPNLVIAAPMNAGELKNLMFTASKSDCPFVIRYPRGAAEVDDTYDREFELLPIGEARVLREGDDLAIISFGHVGNFVSEAIAKAEDKSICHIDLRYAKPLDYRVLDMVAAKFKNVITIEDGSIAGGAGSSIAEYFSSKGCDITLTRLGVGDQFIEHGTMAELQGLCGFDVEGILKKIEK